MALDAYCLGLSSVLFLMAMARLLATSLLVVVPESVGLFGVVSGRLKNLKLRDGSITGLATADSNLLQVLWRAI